MARVWIVVVVLLLASLTFIGWSLGPAMEGRFVPGVYLWDMPLAGMSWDEAGQHVAAALPLQQPNLVLIGPDGQRWALSPAELGMGVDLTETLARAYVTGHSAQGLAAIPARVRIMRTGETLSPVLTWDESLALERLQAIAREVDRPAYDARFRIEGSRPVLEAGNVGRRLEITQTLALLMPHLFSLTPAEIVPPVTSLTPAITDAHAARAVDLADAYLSQPLQLLVPDPLEGDPGPWTVPQDVIADMLVVQLEHDRVSVGLDHAKMAEFLGPLAVSLLRQPVDATFRFDPNTLQMTPITASQVGREMDVAASVELIDAMLRERRPFVPLVMRELPPELPDTLTAEDLGIRELIGVGESYFTGSSSARDHNIRIGTAKYDGLIIKPGQTFSFNEYLGEVTAAEGYDESYVIIGNRTVLGVGGGICQVATTVFRAAYFAGYPIVERWPHAYRVGYYELGGFGPGFDATIYSPIVDLRFTNDTPYHLLIRTEIDAARSRLRFLFYSTDMGRTVEQIGPTTGEQIPPGPPIYEYDPTMPAGTVRRLESAYTGVRAVLGRIVRDAEGRVLYEDTFVSNFRPWPARYRYGPDFTPPPDAEIVTPTP